MQTAQPLCRALLAKLREGSEARKKSCAKFLKAWAKARTGHLNREQGHAYLTNCEPYRTPGAGMTVADKWAGAVPSPAGQSAKNTIDETTPARRANSMMSFAWLRRAVVAAIGFSVLLIGLAMVALPGPAIVVIPLGLAILATEFVWARRLLEKARATIGRKESRRNERTSFADDQNGREP